MKITLLKCFLVLLVIFPLCGSSSYAQDEDEMKGVDLCGEVDFIRQEYSYWCVYACMESLSSTYQCEHCHEYIANYINEYYNPYSGLIDDEEFNEALGDFYNDRGPCENGQEFEKFGVLSPHLEKFIEQEIKDQDLMDLFTDPDLEPILIVAIGLEYGHCYTLVSFAVYNKDLEDEKSEISLMDPSIGEEVSMSFSEFIYEEDLFFFSFEK